MSELGRPGWYAAAKVAINLACVVAITLGALDVMQGEYGGFAAILFGFAAFGLWPLAEYLMDEGNRRDKR